MNWRFFELTLRQLVVGARYDLLYIKNVASFVLLYFICLLFIKKIILVGLLTLWFDMRISIN